MEALPLSRLQGYLGALHPAALASSSEQNQRSPFESSIRVCS